MKIFRQTALLALALAFSAAFAFAQTTGGVKGKVRNSKGDALAGVTVTARLKGEEVKSVKSDSKGGFELTGLAPGVYNFVFDKAGYGSGIKANFEVVAGKTLSLGDNLALATDQGTLVLINGSVYNQDGRSITGAKVEIVRVNADGSTKKIATAFTNVSGEFTLRQPDASARFRVTATMKGVSGSKEIEVDSAGVYRLAITLTLPKEENQ